MEVTDGVDTLENEKEPRLGVTVLSRSVLWAELYSPKKIYGSSDSSTSECSLIWREGLYRDN